MIRTIYVGHPAVLESRTLDPSRGSLRKIQFFMSWERWQAIRDYDIGRQCSRSEIPSSVLTGTKAFAKLIPEGAPDVDVLADHFE